MSDTATLAESPATMPPNWPAIRALAMVVGVREAARRCGVSENAALARSMREGWLDDPKAKAINAEIGKERRREAYGCNQMSSQPGLVLLNEMRELAVKGRYGALKATTKALLHLGDKDADELCRPDVADVLSKHVRSASIAGGYGAAQRVDTVAEAFGGRGIEATVIDAEVIESEEIAGED